LVYGLARHNCQYPMTNVINSHRLLPATTEFVGSLLCRQKPAYEATSDRALALLGRYAG